MTVNTPKAHFLLKGDPGIAIGPILFIIALLAILAAAIAAGNSSYTGGTTQENAKINASAIITSLSDYDNAVDRIRMQGYDDTMISFDMPSGIMTIDGNGDDYEPSLVNPFCSLDNCKIFKPSGGGMSGGIWPKATLDATTQALPVCANTEVCSNPVLSLIPLRIAGLGGVSDFRLGFTAWNTDINVCLKLNDLMNVTNTGGLPPSFTSTQGAYTQNFYNWGTGTSYVFSDTRIYGKKTFCYMDTSIPNWGYVVIHEFF